MKKNILIVILLIFPWIVGFTIYGVRVATYAEIQTGLTIDPDNLSDGDCYRVGILTLTAGETIAATGFASNRAPVYMRWDEVNDGGRIFLFDADATAKDTYPMLGYAITDAASAGDSVNVAVYGTVCRSDDFTLWTENQDEGTPLYASATAGASTVTKPTAPGADIQRIGIVLRVDGTETGDIWLETFQPTSVKIPDAE